MTMNGPNQGRIVLEAVMHKLPSSRKHYHVRLVVLDSGIPFIDYKQVSNFVGTKKTVKTLHFVDLLFADKRHDASAKFAFSIYSIDKTITFLPHDETVMNEWLTKIRELHASLYPEFKRYDSIFEARLLDKGLAATMHIQGHYRLAVCKDSLDLIPLLTVQDQQQQQQMLLNAHLARLASVSNTTNSTATTTTTTTDTNTPNTTSTTTNPSDLSDSSHEHNLNHLHHLNHHHHHNHHHLMHHHGTNLPNNFNSSFLQNHQPQSHHQHNHHHHHHLPQHLPSHQRFCKRHPQLASKTIELVMRSIRRCGHTEANFYIESGRHSQIGEGDLWMALDKKATARQLHELLLATMKLASTTEDQFLFRAPRSRSGSSSDNAHRSQQSRSSSLLCLNADPASNSSNTTSSSNSTNSSSTTVTPTGGGQAIGTTNCDAGGPPVLPSQVGSITSSSLVSSSPTSGGGPLINSLLAGSNSTTSGGGNFLSNLFGNQMHQQPSPVGGAMSAEKSLAAEISKAAVINSISTIPMFPNHDNNNKIEEDGGYLPMA